MSWAKIRNVIIIVALVWMFKTLGADKVIDFFTNDPLGNIPSVQVG